MHASHFLLTLLAAVLVTGCLEIESTTEIRQDCSLQREITVTGDSAEIARGDLPLPLDDQWSRLLDTAADGKHRLTVNRVFANAQEMTRALRGVPGQSITVEASLVTEFDWFYTRYTYTEIWKRYDPFMAVPITEYLSPSEIELFRTHEIADLPYTVRGDSLAMEDASARFEQWRLRNAFESYYVAFLEGVVKLGSDALTAAMVERNKDSLYAHSVEFLEQSKVDSIPTIFARVLPPEETQSAFAANIAGFAAFKDKLRFEERVWRPSYRTSIRMPGILIETNAPSIEGNTALWSDFIGMCYVGDYEMRAASRMVNWWMVVIPAIMLLLLAFLLLRALLRRHRIR